MSVSQLLKYRYTSVFFCLLCQLSVAIVTMWLISLQISLLLSRPTISFYPIKNQLEMNKIWPKAAKKLAI